MMYVNNLGIHMKSELQLLHKLRIASTKIIAFRRYNNNLIVESRLGNFVYKMN